MSPWLASVTSGRISKPDPAPRASGGPGACCAQHSIITACDGTTDEYFCGLCHAWFTQPCPDAELLPIAAGGAS